VVEQSEALARKGDMGGALQAVNTLRRKDEYKRSFNGYRCPMHLRKYYREDGKCLFP